VPFRQFVYKFMKNLPIPLGLKCMEMETEREWR
jgi:hypothetical protein